MEKNLRSLWEGRFWRLSVVRKATVISKDPECTAAIRYYSPFAILLSQYQEKSLQHYTDVFGDSLMITVVFAWKYRLDDAWIAP
eukprot:scaffold41494_cov50-Attheya_sp.AAC.4